MAVLRLILVFVALACAGGLAGYAFAYGPDDADTPAVAVAARAALAHARTPKIVQPRPASLPYVSPAFALSQGLAQLGPAIGAQSEPADVRLTLASSAVFAPRGAVFLPGAAAVLQPLVADIRRSGARSVLVVERNETSGGDALSARRTGALRRWLIAAGRLAPSQVFAMQADVARRHGAARAAHGGAAGSRQIELLVRN